LVGALAFKKDNAKPTLTDARALLNDMIAHPVENYITVITWCGDIGAPILAAEEAPSQLVKPVGFRSPSGDWLSVAFGNDLQRRWESADETQLIESLLSDAEAPILNGTYSRDWKSKSYRAFDPSEERFISETILASTLDTLGDAKS